MLTRLYPAALACPGAPGVVVPLFELYALDADARQRSARALAIESGGATHGRSESQLARASSQFPVFGTDAAIGLRKRRAQWTPQCTRILVDHAAERTNAELVELIAAETGLHFCLDTINTRRCQLGLDTPGRNDWTSPLRRWRPWQGGGKSS